MNIRGMGKMNAYNELENRFGMCASEFQCERETGATENAELQMGNTLAVNSCCVRLSFHFECSSCLFRLQNLSICRDIGFIFIDNT